MGSSSSTEEKLGGGAKIGGYDDLQRYGNSIYSRAKEKLIRDIAFDVFSLMKLQKADRARRAPIEEVVKHLQSIVPNPRKGKHFTNEFNSSAGKQSKMCYGLAQAINKNYGGQIVPSGLSEQETCVKVAEVMDSLFTGLHTEFITVAGDVTRIIKNLETLKQVIDASYKRQVELTNASGDPQLKMQAASVQMFYERIKSELERQLAILSNLMNVSVGPTGKSLIGLLEDNRDFAGTVRDLKADLGTQAFGDKLAYLLSGVSNIAHSAELIDKALKVLGMSTNEFKNASGISDLRLKILKHIEDKSPTSKELDKMMAAADIIYKNDYDHNKISAFLSKHGKGETNGGDDCGCAGGDDFSGEADIPLYALPPNLGGGRRRKMKKDEMGAADPVDTDAPRVEVVEEQVSYDPVDTDSKNPDLENEASNFDMKTENDIPNIDQGEVKMDFNEGLTEEEKTLIMGGNIVGGVDEDDEGLAPYWARKSLGSKIKKKEKYRDLLLKDFRKLLRMHYRNIVDASDKVARRIGTEIPVTDDLYRFVDVFEQVEGIDSANLHIALSGYPKDSTSRQERDNFMNRYHLLLVALEPLIKGPGGSYFKDIYHAAESLVKAIDNFSDKMVKAITEIHIDRPEEVRAALKQTATSFFGGATGAGGEPLFGSGSFVDFNKVKMEMRYYLSIYNIKTNLSRVADEMKDFGTDYDQILGEEAGWLINNIKREYQTLLDDANPYPESSDPAYQANPSMGVDVAAGVNRNAPPAGSVGEMIVNIQAAVVTALVPPPANVLQETKKRALQMYENLRELYTRQMNAKVRMVEVAQAIDLYLRSFADGIARDPDSIKSVIKMLDQVEIVAKWFTDRSGNQLASIFEFFPNAPGYNYSSSAAAGDAVGQNAVVEAQEDKEANIKLPMENANYYEWLDGTTPAAPGIAAAGESRFPGNPVAGRYLDSSKNRVKGLLTLTDKTIKSMRALENILSAFATVGSKFGDIDPLSKTFMSTGQIFNALCEYINVSAYTTRFLSNNGIGPGGAHSVPVKTPYEDQTYPAGGANVPTVLVGGRITAANYTDGTASGGSYGVASGVPDNLGGGVAAAEINAAKFHLTLAMSSVSGNASVNNDNFYNYHNFADRATARRDFSGWLDRFYDTDYLFMMTIKSIVCKIFTVVDAYRLFNRPLSKENSDQYDSLNPLRTILGGAGHVKIVPEALELYLRLPLLAEWYRSKFGFDYAQNPPPAGVPPLAQPDEWRLTIFPSVDGVWGKFIGLIFDKARYVENGNYSEPQLQRMIVEINDIYRNYKSKYPKATTRNIINSFVLEINRVFGFIKQKEIDNYMNERRKYLDPTGRNYGENKDADFNQYDILDAEDQYGRNPAPSDKFVTVADRQKYRRERSLVHMQKYILQLRKLIDADFRNYTNVRGARLVNFVDLLRGYKSELDNAKSEKDEYNLVLRVMQGTNSLANVGTDKLIMLHESVAAPLAALYNVYKVMAKYNALLHGASLVNIRYWDLNPPAAPGTIFEINHNQTNALRDAYVTILRGKYIEDRTNNYYNCEMFANALIGVSIARNPLAAANLGTLALGYIDRPAAGAGDVVVAAGNLLPQVNREKLAKDLITALLDLSTNPNSLVRAVISEDGRINVDWSSLEELCNNLLQQVKNNLNAIRIEFTQDNNRNLVDKFTQKDYVGSVNWLEEHLIEQLFKDRDRCGLPTAHTNHLSATLADLFNPANNRANETLENIMAEMIYYRRHGQGLRDAAVGNNMTTFPFNIYPLSLEVESLSQPQKDDLNNAKAGNFAAIPGIDTLNNLMKVPNIMGLDTNTINQWTFNYGDNNRRFTSLMQTFNNIVHQYLYHNFDDGTQKIYPGLFESFMNSAASDEVVQNNAFPNIGNYNPAGGARFVYPANLKSPAPNSLLYKSNALIMSSVMTNMDKLLKKRRNTYDSLAEIPEYMKERMRCNLPLYSKLFQLVFNRTDMLRRLINNTGLGMNIAVAAGGPIANIVGLASINNDAAYLNRVFINIESAAVFPSEDNKKYLDGVLAHLCDLTLAIKKCCDGVYKELQDVAPYFMDLSKDFITDYRSRYGDLPFMPTSTILLPQLSYNGLYNTIAGAANMGAWMNDSLRTLLLPNKFNGSSAYKFNLASRVLLVRNDVEPQMDHLPGAKEIYNNYAALAQKNSMIPTNEYANTLKMLIQLSRFLNDGAVYSRLFANKSSHYTNVAESYPNRYHNNSVYGAVYSFANAMEDVAANATPSFALGLAEVRPLDPIPGGAHVGIVPNPANQEAYDDYRNKLEPICVPLRAKAAVDVINLVENSNKKQSKENFIRKLLAVNNPMAGLGREQIRVHNILDLNIVPINVHAFMKEVPFVNILNYSYTFDRMVHDFIAPNYVRDLGAGLNDTNIIIPSHANVTSTRGMFVKLLVHPHSTLGANAASIRLQYYGYIGSLFNGNDDLKLGRPRYLSDQLWHKVLLTSSAQLAVDRGLMLRPDQYPILEMGPSGYEAQRNLYHVQQGQLLATQTDYNNLIVAAALPLAAAGVAAAVDAASPNPQHTPNITPGLKYWHKDRKNWVTKAAAGAVMAPNNVLYLAELGNVRFNTKLVRNLTWMVNLQRVMRVILINHLSWIDTPVVRGLKIVDPVVTEYNSNDQYNNADFQGTEYSAM